MPRERKLVGLPEHGPGAANRPRDVAQRSPVGRSSASRSRWSTSSGYGTPDGSHIRGNIENGVNPGMVFSSLTMTSPVVGDEHVDPGQPLARHGLERTQGHVLHRSTTASGRSAGQVSLTSPSSRYLASKS